MSEELKLEQCPKCKSTNIGYENLGEQLETYENASYRYECKDCHYSPDWWEPNLQDAADYWNMRPIETELRARVAELEAQNTWIPVAGTIPALPTLLPLIPGIEGKRYFVRAQEFGCDPAYAVARAWVSFDNPLRPKWYLDKDFYHLEMPLPIAQPVTHYMPFPKDPEATK